MMLLSQGTPPGTAGSDTAQKVQKLRTNALKGTRSGCLGEKAYERLAFTSWIKENIKKKECSLFLSKEEVCYCGYLKTEHSNDAIKPENFTGLNWDKHKHVHEVPTDAFGQISFAGRGERSQYVRVSTDTKPEVLYQLLTEQWKLPPPNLLISVTGGAKNFYLNSHLQKAFHRGLIKVAQTTGAWIITGGTHAGVMKHVGQALREYALTNSMQEKIVAIGVAPWGVIHNRDKLVDKEGCFLANYMIDSKGQGRLSCLDNNHTHFLLVDDGTSGNYGVEIELRARLEKYICKRNLENKANALNIPTVYVVLDGGPGTLNTLLEAMQNNIPCVILEGSGRLADVIAQVSGLQISGITIGLIQKLIKKFFGREYETFTDLNIVEWTKKIQDIIRMSHLLTIFREQEDNHGDAGMDLAILQALFKGSRTDESRGADSWKRQLELAIIWNRADLAQREIFKEESQWKSSDLHWALKLALVGNKPEFVSLLLKHGVSLKDFLQDDNTLCELYEQLPKCFFKKKLDKRVKHAEARGQALYWMGPHHAGGIMTHVSKEVRRLLGYFTKHIYPPPTKMYRSNISTETRDTGHRDPASDLFLWAVIQKNRKLAEITWEQCRDCIAAALAASKILKKMAEETNADEAGKMVELASHFEDHAIGVFKECDESDDERGLKLLVRVSSFWGGTTCLRLALEADNKNFVAHSGVQDLLTQIWCGELSVESPVWKVLICMFFFPLIYTRFLVFRQDELKERQIENNEEIKTNLHCSPLDCWSRLEGLYCSPQVKFYGNIISHCAFLMLFAWVLMMDFQSMPSTGEKLLYIWLLSLVYEEIRQLFHDPDGFGFRKKAEMYISQLWNVLDVLSIVLFCLGIGFRFTVQLFYAGKIILCIDFVVFCLRLMAIFTISRTLGPKIIIIKKMVKDMFFFMFMLSICVVAYGVAKQGILINNDSRLEWIIHAVVYEPYMIIFGNFPENIDKAGFDINSCSLNGTDPLKPKCPVLTENQIPAFPEWLINIMLCVYLLFANVLLINLLIAIFSYTFEEVHDNTDKFWKFQRYELIKEYHSRPAAPPPFIILSHLWLFREKMLCKDQISHNDFRQMLSESEEEELLSWEALMKDRYLLSAQKKQRQSMEKRILDTSQKVTTITDWLERKVMVRLEKLEQQVTQSTKAQELSWDNLISQGLLAKHTQTQTSAAQDKSSDSLRRAPEKDQSYHVMSRQLSYPKSKITRFPVPEEKVPWKVSFSSYTPTEYNPGHDGDDDVDGSKLEDLDNYRNPVGRTGIRGRGSFSRLGPNLNIDLVVTRWRDSSRSMLEYLMAFNQDSGSLSLPGGPVYSMDRLPENLKEILGRKLFEILNAKLSAGTKVSGGYVDDCRNTDNAWVETTVINIHLDRTSQVIEDINKIVMSSHSSLKWQELSSGTGLSSNQRRFLQQMLELQDGSK